jgi:predicted dehydrogenase
MQRVLWLGTSWFRTQAYYDSGAWRATWKGEGGGVLLNQCPHDLDLLVWLLGAPCRVHAHLTLGKYHRIEVEDEVTAYMEYPNGATGVFIASTGEAPGSGHWEFCGDSGKLSMSEGKLEFLELVEPASKFLKESKASFATPEKTRLLIETPGGGGHKVVTENFVKAILDGEPLVAPAVEGLESIEMANAMIMSGIQGRAIDIPMDRDAYDAFLKELIAKSEKR